MWRPYDAGTVCGYIFAIMMCPRIREDGHLYWTNCEPEEMKYAPGGGINNVLAVSMDYPPWMSSQNNATRASYDDL